jgi:uncharacterized integral membrane protein
MLRALWRGIYEELGRRAGVYLTIAAASGAVGGVYFWDPFYHAGWLISYKGWIGLFVVICGIAILASYSPIGLIVVGILALLVAGVFAHLYGNLDYQHSNWPFWTWILHLVFVSLVAGILVGAGAQVLRGRTSKRARTRGAAK